MNIFSGIGFYQHFKGGLYFKLLNSRDCNDSDKELSIYLALQKNDEFKVGQPWSRESDEFNGVHPVKEVKRMEKLSLMGLVKLLYIRIIN